MFEEVIPVDFTDNNKNDFMAADTLPPMFAAYPDVVGVPEFRQMLGGISEKLAGRIMRERIEHIEIGRERKTTKWDVIVYINKNKRKPNDGLTAENEED
jgi:hypothetical protein